MLKTTQHFGLAAIVESLFKFSTTSRNTNFKHNGPAAYMKANCAFGESATLVFRTVSISSLCGFLVGDKSWVSTLPRGQYNITNLRHQSTGASFLTIHTPDCAALTDEQKQLRAAIAIAHNVGKEEARVVFARDFENYTRMALSVLAICATQCR